MGYDEIFQSRFKLQLFGLHVFFFVFKEVNFR